MKKRTIRLFMFGGGGKNLKEETFYENNHTLLEFNFASEVNA